MAQTPNRLPSRGSQASGPALEGTLREIKQAVDRIAEAMGDGADVDVSSLAKEVTLGQLLTAILGVIAPAGTPAVPSLNVNVVETVGGGGGGGDATAANQVLEISALNSILAKIIAAPSTEAKQDAIIAALGPLATEVTVANILAALATPALPAGAATEVTLAAILAAMGAPPLPSGAATEATQLLNWGLLGSINSALGSPLTINLPAGISTEAKQDAIITALGLLSTAANQTTGNTTLASILAALSGTLAVSAASLPLPTGASTAANQTTGNNYLYSIDQWLQALYDAQRQQGQTVGSAQTWLSAARQRATPSDEATEGTVAWLQMSGGRLYTRTILDAAVPAGANVIGKVSIDQTTPGTTNAVEVIQVPALVKGTQGARGLSVQPLRDAGRTSVVYRPSHSIGAYAGFTSDTAYAATMYKATGDGTVSASGTSFVIPSGKTFRVQAFRATMMVQSTSAVVTRVQVGLLINPAGAVTTASSLALTMRLTGQATAGLTDHEDITIPEGFDIVGDGTLQIGVYLLANFASGSGPTIQFNLVGYEF